MPEQLSRGHRELVTAPGDGATRLRDIGYDHLMFLAGPRLRRAAWPISSCR
ncbi:MAG TPA: hypothetical protein VFT24_12920 [Vicinamibacterales bacterium]|nr:hypothetical protein [Vicinamibacterales bacterium]